ncbi:molecular chaperone TorD family protein [Azospirillum sp. HJ39]|uniref:molecular chaperone TorD family protein n=1 Tax=Azospirillum sp. HJ39 TaxID=3159496 RepID=UPI0035568217
MESTVLETAALPPCRGEPSIPDARVRADEPAFADAAEALRHLVRFQAEEPTPSLLAALRKIPVSRGPLALDRDDAIQAAALIDEVVSDLPQRITRRSLVPLAADFAAIHRSGDLGACPTESPWLDEGARPDAAASLQCWRAGLEWDLRRPPLDRLPEDHVAAELALLALLLDRGRPADAVRFLDRHPLRWVPGFCSRIATRCREPFFAGVAILTNAHLDHLRDRLGAACGLPRASDDGSDIRRRRWTEGRFPRACACDP